MVYLSIKWFSLLERGHISDSRRRQDPRESRCQLPSYYGPPSGEPRQGRLSPHISDYSQLYFECSQIHQDWIHRVLRERRHCQPSRQPRPNIILCEGYRHWNELGNHGQALPTIPTGIHMNAWTERFFFVTNSSTPRLTHRCRVVLVVQGWVLL